MSVWFLMPMHTDTGNSKGSSISRAATGRPALSAVERCSGGAFLFSKRWQAATHFSASAALRRQEPTIMRSVTLSKLMVASAARASQYWLSVHAQGRHRCWRRGGRHLGMPPHLPPPNHQRCGRDKPHLRKPWS